MDRDVMLYQVYDKVAESVEGMIFGQVNDAAAIRMFYDLLGDKRTQPGQHPGDYVLMLVGEQDREGMILPVKPQPVATGSSWLEQQNRERMAQQTLKLEGA